MVQGQGRFTKRGIPWAIPPVVERGITDLCCPVIYSTEQNCPTALLQVINDFCHQKIQCLYFSYDFSFTPVSLKNNCAFFTTFVVWKGLHINLYQFDFLLANNLHFGAWR